MSESPSNNIHSSHSNPSHLLLQGPPQVGAVEIDKGPLRIVPFPALRDRILQLFLHQDHSSGYHAELSSTKPGPRLAMASWLKAAVPRMVYDNMHAFLFTGLLAGSRILRVMFASIHNSRSLDSARRAGKVVLSTAHDAPFLAMVRPALIWGVVALSMSYVWLINRTFLPTLLDSVLGIGMPLLNVCAARGRQWLVTAFMTAAATTTTTLVGIVIYILYERLTGSAQEEQTVLKEARVA